MKFLSDFSKTEHNDTGSKANGYFKQFKTAKIMLKIVITIFKNTWGLQICTILLLQSKSLDFKLSVQILKVLIQTWEIHFTFYGNLQREWSDLNLYAPKESRKRNKPQKYEDRITKSFKFSPESKYNQIYKEIIVHILSGLQLR